MELSQPSLATTLHTSKQLPVTNLELANIKMPETRVKAWERLPLTSAGLSP